MDRDVNMPNRDSKALNMTASSLFPILSSNRKLWRSGYLVHAAVTAIAGTAFLWAAESGNAGVLFQVLAYYVTYVQCVVVYYLCGRENVWPAMLGTFFLCWFLMISTPLFSVVAPPFRSQETMAMMQGNNFGSVFVGYFVATGMAEEFYKALPLLVLATMTLLRRRGVLAPKSERWGLSEPLDGIALGVAAGAAFATAETLVQYVPDAVNESGGNVLTGLVTLLVRLISQLGGHLAYSGYLGYFIGCAVLRPKAAPLYLAVGFLTSAALHGLWNTLAHVQAPVALMTLLAAVSIAFLIAAILKARRISPTRSQNFATVTYPAADVAAPLGAAVQPARDVPTHREAARQETERRAPAPADSPAAAMRSVVINIGPFSCTAVPGFEIEPRMLGSAGAGRGRGPVAEVLAAAEGSSGLRLRNLGERAWRVRSPKGSEQDVAKDGTVVLAPGTVIDFGGVKGVVHAG